jgi:hypothetical protein
MATTTNYGWTTPDDTALVKDGAAAIRTLGSSIDTTLKTQIDAQIPDSLLTTKGDLIAATGASTPARLAVGTNDQVLVADSTTATGLKWGSVAAGANWSLLNAGGTTLTGAQTITVSGISGKDKIMILVDAAGGGASTTIAVRLNTDTASNYYAYGSQIQSNASYDGSVIFNRAQGARAFIRMCEALNTSDAISGYVLLSGCNSAGVKVFNGITGQNSDSGAGVRGYNTGGYYNSSSTISSISLFSSVGNFDSGTVFVYTSA